MIFVECKPDLILLRSVINVPRKESLHEFKGKYEICKRLERLVTCKALIDEDPLSIPPPYVRKLRLENDLVQHGLRLLHDSSRDNYVVVLCPELEEWVLKAAREADINVKRYGLPDDAEELRRVINIRLDEFERLLAELKGSARLKALARALGTNGVLR